MLEENVPFVVRGGDLDSLVFRMNFGHRRNFRSMSDYSACHGAADLTEVPFDAIARIPIGPPMPATDLPELQELLQSSSASDTIREALVSKFAGKGYEIGAGRRPTIVQAECSVSYVDRFTFEEAADGSFVGLTNESFVNVTHFEAMDSLPSIPPATADFFIACHVIEHVPDVIGAIRTVCDRLKPGKQLMMVVPYATYMFDRNRPITTLSHFIADSLQQEPPMLDHYLEYSRLAKKHPNWVQDGQDMYNKNADFHPHTFIPESMTELLAYLRDLGLFTAFEVFNPAKAADLIEFYVLITR